MFWPFYPLARPFGSSCFSLSFVDNQENVHIFDRQAIKEKLATRPFCKQIKKRRFQKQSMTAKLENLRLANFTLVIYVRVFFYYYYFELWMKLSNNKICVNIELKKPLCYFRLNGGRAQPIELIQMDFVRFTHYLTYFLLFDLVFLHQSDRTVV